MGLDILLAIVGSMFASSGFWAYVQHRANKKDASTKMIIGLGHDRIITLGLCYIDRGWVTKDEYENFHDFLYLPYKEMGGNGSVTKIVTDVGKLPIRSFGINNINYK